MSKPHSSRFLDLKPAPRDPKVAALFGPRDLKTPGSEEWIIQSTSRAVRIWHSLDRTTQEWSEIVGELDAQQVWKKYPKGKPYGTRDAFYRSELGAPEPMLTQLKEAQQLMAVRHAGPGRGKKTADNISGFQHGTQAAYIRARLERDGKTELLARIERGELTAHAAAVEAGFRQRLIQIAPTVPGFLKAAQSHLSPEQRLDLKEAL